MPACLLFPETRIVSQPGCACLSPQSHHVGLSPRTDRRVVDVAYIEQTMKSTEYTDDNDKTCSTCEL